MTRPRFLNLSCLVLSLALCTFGTGARSDPGKFGFSAAEIAEAATVEGKTVGGVIMDVRTVLLDEGEPGGLAFEILKAKEWRIVYVRFQGGRARLGWVSAPLGPPFDMVPANEGMRVVRIEGRPALAFRACNENLCHTIFGIALYRLSDGRPFVAKVEGPIGNETSTDVKYSPDLLLPEYKPLKDWIDDHIKDDSLSGSN